MAAWRVSHIPRRLYLYGRRRIRIIFPFLCLVVFLFVVVGSVRSPATFWKRCPCDQARFPTCKLREVRPSFWLWLLISHFGAAMPRTNDSLCWARFVRCVASAEGKWIRRRCSTDSCCCRCCYCCCYGTLSSSKLRVYKEMVGMAWVRAVSSNVTYPWYAHCHSFYVP